MSKFTFVCKDFTATDCDFVGKAETREELYEQIEKHGAEAHSIIVEDEEQRAAIKKILDMEIKESE